MKRTFIVVLFCFCYLFSNGQTTSAKPAEISKIAVLSLKISHKENTNAVSIMQSAILHQGSKGSETESHHWQSGDFVCFLLDAEQHILDTLIIEHPLKSRYEYPGEGGEILSTTMDLPENNVLIRFPFSSAMKSIQVHEVNQNRVLLNSGTLNLPSEE